MKCAQCGAVNDPRAHACAYCRAPTELGIRAQHEEEQRASWYAAQQAQAQHAQRAAATLRMESAASTALWTSLVSWVVCCVPVLQIVSIVMWARARTTARELGVAVPGRAVAGLWVSIASIVGGIAFVAWAIVRDQGLEQAAAARIAELDKQTAVSAQAATLDQKTACALAEAYALESGYAEERGHDLRAFECNGALHADAERARLGDFRFKSDSNDTVHTTVACFKKGAKWFVTELTDGGDCGVSPAPSASSAKCARVGGRCEVSPGKLGTCVALEDRAGGERLVCQSQH